MAWDCPPKTARNLLAHSPYVIYAREQTQINGNYHGQSGEYECVLGSHSVLEGDPFNYFRKVRGVGTGHRTDWKVVDLTGRTHGRTWKVMEEYGNW